MSKIKRWTESELQFLRDHHSDMTHQEIADHLGRSRNAVRGKCSEMGYIDLMKFTESEIAEIAVYYSKAEGKSLDLNALAKKMGRNKTSIAKKAKELGLTDMCRPMSEKVRQEMSQTLKDYHKTHEHPRGMLGKKHSAETLQVLSERSKEKWADPNSKLYDEEMRQRRSEKLSRVLVQRAKEHPEQIHSRAKAGKRKDIGIYVRSAWEANVARYLNWLIEKGEIYKWEYEPDTYWFENIKRGSRSYTPDFKIWDREDSDPYYWEVKGYMDQKSKTKLKRIAKYYPQVKIVLITKKEYKEISKWSGLISNWE